MKKNIKIFFFWTTMLELKLWQSNNHVEQKIKGAQVLYWNKKEIYLTKKANIYKELC